MAGVMPYEGSKYIWDVIFDNQTPLNLTVRLYQNNVSLTQNVTNASFTECNQTGYSAVQLDRGASSEWTVTLGTDSAATVAVGDDAEFDFTAGTGDYAYGYYITFNDGSQKVIYAEAFDSPQALGNGVGIDITPDINLATDA